MTLKDCVVHCAGVPELVAEFDRLTGSNLSLRGTSLDLMIDEATGRQREEMREFTAFVFECIWLPLIAPSLSASREV